MNRPTFHVTLHRLLHNGKTLVDSIFFHVFCVFPINSTKILFSSFLGKSYSDNPRAISEMLHKMAPSWTIVWLMSDPLSKASVVPPYVTMVKPRSLAALYHRTTAKYWIDNYTLSPNCHKRSSQVYIQTWHGDRAFKKVLADMLVDKTHYKSYEAKHCDLALSGSSFAEMVYRSSFLYEGDLLKFGTPKCDILINDPESASTRVRDTYSIPKDKKILLYAPTFRDADTGGVQVQKSLDFECILHALQDSFGGEWILMIRGHTGRTLQFSRNTVDYVIDATSYEDSADVLAAADALISDYSSVVGDYALLGRPIFLYLDDYEDYREHSRDTWFDLETMPFPYALNQDELVRLIKETTYESAKTTCISGLNAYGTYETGRATEEVCNYILMHN